MRLALVTTVCVHALSLLFSFSSCASHLGSITLRDAVRLTEDHCLVLAVEPAPNRPLFELVQRVIDVAWVSDESVAVGHIDLSQLDADKFVRLDLVDGQRPQRGDLLVLEKRVPDRSCLLTDSLKYVALPGALLNEMTIDEEMVLRFVNDRCGTFFTADGSLSFAGLHRQAILSELTSVSTYPNSITMSELVEKCSTDLRGFFYNGQCSSGDQCRKEASNGSTCHHRDEEILSIQSSKMKQATVSLPSCDVLSSPPTRQRFMLDYVGKSRPVVIRNAINHWPALSEWTNEAFRARFGANETHVKLTPGGEFEGVEPISLWNDSHFVLPAQVKAALRFSDLVMVRPEGLDMKIAEFLDLIEHRSKNSSFLSAYLEYSPIRQHMKGLEKDVPALSFASDLDLTMLNIWLSDGNTLGKLHMDQYDNLLCQLSGRKQLILFDPSNNEQMYEGHILEAMLRYSNGSFHRDRLMRSTALTMSPVDITKPDFQKFPSFAHARPMRCEIEKGDILYLPSFWWHEVQSYPNATEGRNLAVNFWYQPFLTKQFPCEECKLDVNLTYRHLL